MGFRKLCEEKGITIVELLAAITLLSITILLSTSIISQLYKNNNTSADHINLTQTTNVLLQDLKYQYHSRSSNLCLDEEDYGISIEHPIITQFENTLEWTNGCVVGVDPGKPLHVQFTTVKSDQSLHIQTTWTNEKDLELAMDIISPEDESEYIPYDGSPYYNGNTIFDEDVLDNSVTVEGNAWFPNKVVVGQGIGNRTEITIEKNLYVDNGLELGNSSIIRVDGNAQINGSLNFDMRNSSEIHIDENATFNGAINMDNGSSIVIGGNAVFNKNITLKNNATIMVKGTAMFANNINISGNGSICLLNEPTPEIKHKFGAYFNCN